MALAEPRSSPAQPPQPLTVPLAESLDSWPSSVGSMKGWLSLPPFGEPAPQGTHVTAPQHQGLARSGPARGACQDALGSWPLSAVLVPVRRQVPPPPKQASFPTLGSPWASVHSPQLRLHHPSPGPQPSPASQLPQLTLHPSQVKGAQRTTAD